jgi:hypothetical protein
MSIELDFLREYAPAEVQGTIANLERLDALRASLAEARMILEDHQRALPLLVRRSLSKKLGTAYDDACAVRRSLWSSLDSDELD